MSDFPPKLTPIPAAHDTHPNCAAACGGTYRRGPLQAGVRGEARTADSNLRPLKSRVPPPAAPSGPDTSRLCSGPLDLRGCTLGPLLPPPPSLPPGPPPPTTPLLTSPLSISPRPPPPGEGGSGVPQLPMPRDPKPRVSDRAAGSPHCTADPVPSPLPLGPAGRGRGRESRMV